MKYALIGCGRVSTNHVRSALENGLDIIALCDVIPDHMEAIAARHNLPGADKIRRYTSHRELMANESPELVGIATESGCHAEIAVDCINAGCNVIIEKPIAMSLGDADRIIAAMEAKGVKVSACHQNRFNDAIQELRAALDAGRFGKLSHGSVNIRWMRDRAYYDQAPWRGTWALDGGTLMNQCIHGIDLLRWVMGNDIDTVYGFTANRHHDYIEGEDIGVAVVRFKNGAVATIEGTVNVYPKDMEETLCVFGETGTVKIGGTNVNKVENWDFADEHSGDEAARKLHEASANVYGNGHHAIYADTIDAIKNARQPYVSAYDGRRALELVLAIYRSQKTGMPVKLPMDDFATIEMAGVFGS